MGTLNDVKDKLKNKNESAIVPQEEKGKPKTILEVIEDRKGDLAQVLPNHFPVDKFVRLAIGIIKGNPKLQACTGASLFGALVQAAQLGLEVNSPLHQASIVPFKNKKKINGVWTEVYEAQFMWEYRGLLQLMWNSGLVKDIDFDMICENDVEFVYEKTQDGIKFVHKPLLKGKRENAYAYYATATTSTGGFTCVVMSKESIIDFAKTHSKAVDYKTGELTGIWKDDFDSMAIKTVLKQLADKRLPKAVDRATQEFQRALSTDETIKTNIATDMSELNDETGFPPENVDIVDTEYTETTDENKAQE